MEITEGLIERFLNGDCNAAEQAAVRKYFAEHPAKLEQLLSEGGWENFSTGQSLPVETSGKMLQSIRDKTYQKKAIPMGYRWAAAAAILAAILTTTYFLQQHQPPSSGLAAIKTAVQKDMAYVDQHEFNHTDKTISFTLNDGSTIELSPGSEVSYAVPFQNNRRNIYLKGEALFRVAKDQAKPFTVYAGRLATTALGTVFKITAFEKEIPTRVQLLSGKVMVEPDSMLQSQGIKTAYLEPGQELRFDALKMVAVISTKDKTLHNNGLAATRHNMPDKAMAAVNFQDEALGNMFRALAHQYHQRIVFREAQLTGMSFTGTFDPGKETLTNFIQTTCLLNQLTMRQEGGVIYISAGQ